jgi:hypothetical protein
MIRIAFALVTAIALNGPVFCQDSAAKDKNLDIRSSVGDVHIGADADAKKVGVPLYPGARVAPKDGDNNNDPANLSILTEAFGVKLIVANYISDDAPDKVLNYYRDKLKKYGKVLECRAEKQDVSVHDDDKDSGKGKELKCDQNSGPVTELKVGTEDNQRVVAVEPGQSSKGSKFSLVYVHTRGKSADI